MVFRINNPQAKTAWFKNRIIVLVGNYIRIRAIKPSEKPLNDWLLKTYHRNLTDISLILLNYIKAMKMLRVWKMRYGKLIMTGLP